MESLILLAVPIVASVLTQMVKSISSIKFSDYKKSILRFVAATLSFIGVVLTSAMAGEEVSATEIEVYVQTFAAFMATQIPYWMAKLR